MTCRLIIVSLVALAVLAGCITGPQSPGTDRDGPPSTPIPETESPTETPGDGSNETDSGSTSTYEIKTALMEKYDPGTCFGMPSVISEERMNEMVEGHNQLTNRFCSDYDVEKNQTQRLYTMIQQYQQIEVMERSDGQYNFTVRDGNCCTITTIEGVYDSESGEITETNRTEETTPC